MTKRDIIKALLNKEIPERVGLNESFWPHIIENAWNDQGIAAGTNFVDRFNLDIRGMTWYTSPKPRPDLRAEIDESDEWVVYRDGWGVRTTARKCRKAADLKLSLLQAQYETPDCVQRPFGRNMMTQFLRRRCIFEPAGSM